MKKYFIQTGWIHGGKTPSFKGSVDILAINKEVADMCVLTDYVYMREIVSETCAKDLEGTKLMPKGNDIYLGFGGLIAN